VSERRFAYAFFALVALAVADYQFYAFSSLHSLFADFRAFWCGAGVLAAHGNPYHAAPMIACERAGAPPLFYRPPAQVALPAPLPGYALAVFLPLSLLPYVPAAIVWFALASGATAVCALLLSAILRASVLACCWALLLPAFALWLPYGELVPVALAGALLAAWALQREQYGLAATGLAIAAILPQLALGVWVACAVLVPRLRVQLGLAGGMLCAVWAATGTSLGIEYMRDVLPLHALAELPRLSQYSVSWIAHALGTDAGTALAAGLISWCVTLGLGIPAGRALARKWNDPAPIVLAPLAAAAMGGSFVHAGELIAALPIAMAVALRTVGTARMLACSALVTLMLPWYVFRFEFALIPIAILVAGVTVGLLSRQTVWGMRAALIIALCIGSVTAISAHDLTLRERSAVPLKLTQDRVAASASWGRYVWSTESSVSLSALLAKVPVWVALLLLVGGTWRAVADKELVPAVRVEHMPTAS
jgi:hypothetical protein